MPGRELPSEAYDLSINEIADVTQFSTYKTIGSILVTLNEACPVNASDHAIGPSGMHLRIGATDQVPLLHLDYVNGPQQLRHDVVRVASYMQLQPEFREYDAVIGVTYQQLANFAVRAFGCRAKAIDEEDIDTNYRAHLEDVYYRFPLSRDEALEPALIYMGMSEFTDRFGAKHLGTSLQEVCDRLERGDTFTRTEGAPLAGADPTLAAITSAIGTMESK